MVGFQPSHQSECVVAQVMQLGGVATVLALGYCQYLQSAVNFLTQLYRNLQLSGDRYRLSHLPIVLHPHCLWKALYPAPLESLPTKLALSIVERDI